jgi:hypothetical protein
METSRREFLGRVAATTAMLGMLPLTAEASGRSLDLLAVDPLKARPPGQDWDLSWVDRLTGKYRAVFDVPEIDSGYGVWRASIWVNQYADVLKVSPKELSPVLVLRHKGINLAMQQPYWDKYGVAKTLSTLHPVTQQPTDRNPALLSSARGELPAQLDAFALDKYIARGGIALACDLALQDVEETIRKKDNVSAEEARKRALAYMVPGVILQPSGVFAALRAQDAGCRYLRAS